MYQYGAVRRVRRACVRVAQTGPRACVGPTGGRTTCAAGPRHCSPRSVATGRYTINDHFYISIFYSYRKSEWKTQFC